MDKDRKDYIDALDTVQVPLSLIESTKELVRLKGHEINRSRKKSYKKTVAAAVAAAILAMVLFVPDTSAQYVKKIFAGFWSSNKDVGSHTKQADGGLYTDGDTHIKMSVEEILSDEVCIQAVIKFQAKDETGIKWLNDYNPEPVIDDGTLKEKFWDTLYVGADSGSGQEKSGMAGILELEKYKSDKERYFSLQYLAKEPVDKGVLYYSLTSGGDRKMEIDIKSNVPVYNYDLILNSSQEISMYYKPKKIRMSKLSVVIYGKDTGLFATGTENTQEFSKEYIAEDKEILKPLGMIKEDGSIEKTGITGLSAEKISKKARKDNKGCDCSLFSDQFCRLAVTGTGNNDSQGRQGIVNFSPEKYKGISLETENGKAEYLFKQTGLANPTCRAFCGTNSNIIN